MARMAACLRTQVRFLCTRFTWLAFGVRGRCSRRRGAALRTAGFEALMQEQTGRFCGGSIAIIPFQCQMVQWSGNFALRRRYLSLLEFRTLLCSFCRYRSKSLFNFGVSCVRTGAGSDNSLFLFHVLPFWLLLSQRLVCVHRRTRQGVLSTADSDSSLVRPS